MKGGQKGKLHPPFVHPELLVVAKVRIEDSERTRRCGPRGLGDVTSIQVGWSRDHPCWMGTCLRKAGVETGSRVSLLVVQCTTKLP